MTTQHSDDPRLNPFPWYRTMREFQPVAPDPRRGGWGVFRYDAVQEVLSNHSAFSSQWMGSTAPDSSQPFAASMIASDPPRHRQLRALVTQAFTPRAISLLEARIWSIVHMLLDSITLDTMDVVRAFAEPLPVIVIAELLGIPSRDRVRFKQWSDAVVSYVATNGMTSFQAQREMVTYFSEIIAQRRVMPDDDLMSALLQAEIAGERLTLPELLGFCVLLLVAGNETTTNLISNAMLCLSERPAAWQRLRANPALVPAAVEEVLRFRSPVQAMFRVATKDTALGGSIIPRGASVSAYIGSANHDERQFANPDQFDIDRHPNRHVAFGYSIHYCVGAPLARLEATIALTALLERIQHFQRVADTPLQAIPSGIVYGVRQLPIRFVAEKR